MLKIGKLTDYALVLLNQLASADRPYSVGESDVAKGFNKYSVDTLSRETGLSEATVRKVMRFLVGAKLVIAHRGTKGGYQLALPPSKISIIDVVSAVEGPVSVTECASEDNNCEITDQCSLSDNWPGINQLVVSVFRQISLEDVRKTNVSDQLKQTLLSQWSHSSSVSPDQMIKIVEVD